MRWPLIFLAALLLSACIGPSLKDGTSIGAPIEMEKLATLTVGRSSEAEVDKALGPPSGRGQWRLPGEPRPLALRVHDYRSRRSNEMKLVSLIVFLKDGIYVGHYWFDANPMLE